MIHNDLTCTICVDIVTDIDEFITDDTTEQQILDFFNQICTVSFTVSQTFSMFSQFTPDIGSVDSRLWTNLL